MQVKSHGELQKKFIDMKIYKVFNQEQWHVSKAKHLIWDNLIMDAKIARDRMVKFVKISAYLAEALLKGLTKLGGGGQGKSFVDGIG